MRTNLSRHVRSGLPALVLTALFAGSGRAQEGSMDSQRTVSVYLIDRGNSALKLDDAAACLTIRRRSGTGATVLLARVSPESWTGGANGEDIGILRGLVGSPAVVELFWHGSSGRGPREEDVPKPRADAPAPPRPGGPEPKQTQDPRDLIRRAHRGSRFVASLPASQLAEVTSAWVSIRLGSRSWTSEEFGGPSVPEQTEAAVLAEMERLLKTIRDRVNDGASFMNLRPPSVRLVGALAKLSPEGFWEPTGTFEGERQGCLALARSMEDACSRGDWGRMSTLSLQCEPRVRNLASLRKEPERLEVPTLDPR
ncbi:MAG TPA: hypothetical protein VKW04_13360 [Planctomycetota bacterium]|nr:hypothetical protein [Planctomycetota bacterium]